ncbi:MAG: protein-glutamate O-methyltransferase CheR [Cytophagaceae bacterium]|jgi:chemotaxis protein methyltransferase CheR|nr:protein-glutamate O-methyltransferase CheR [Cytophagaceae bacterium]
MQNEPETFDFRDYLKILKDYSPYDFSDYSDNSIARRVEKVMRDYRMPYGELVERTKNDTNFVEEIVEALAVNTTELFRDPVIWSFLLENIYPALKKKTNINVWHAGCSSGQEVYSNMIMLEHLRLLDRSMIYATDISKKVLEQAKRGVYKYNFNKGYIDNFNKVFANKEIDFARYFDVNEAEDKFIVKDILKGKTKFIKYDLVQEQLPFYNKFDIIFCRNVLIYFNINLQSKIISRFYQNLFPGGMLLLGNHETISGFYKTKFLKHGPVYSKNNTFHFK